MAVSENRDEMNTTGSMNCVWTLRLFRFSNEYIYDCYFLSFCEQNIINL